MILCYNHCPLSDPKTREALQADLMPMRPRGWPAWLARRTWERKQDRMLELAAVEDGAGEEKRTSVTDRWRSRGESQSPKTPQSRRHLASLLDTRVAFGSSWVEPRKIRRPACTLQRLQECNLATVELLWLAGS